jgi:hypothetical protein
VIDPDVSVIVRLMEERLADQEVSAEQREVIWALIACVRSQERALHALTGLGIPDL